MQMSMGMIVVIVLSILALVLGVFLTQRIFSGATNAIDQIDTKIQNEINNLFSTDQDAKYSAFPKERDILIEKGESGGFGFSVINRDLSEGIFSYTTVVSEISSNCQVTKTQAEDFIILGKQNTGRRLGSGDILEDPFFVKFQIPETAPLCQITYTVEIEKDGLIYTGFSKILNIK